MSRVIPEATNVAFERWQAPHMQETGAPTVSGRTQTSQAPTAKQLGHLQQQAYDEGFEIGRKEGRLDGLAAGQAQLNQLLTVMSQPLGEIDESTIEQLSQLAMTIARQLVRRELNTSPGEIIAVVREALALLPVASAQVSLSLHPEDALLVKEVMATADGGQPWRIVEDPMLARGGCRIATEISQIDATVEKRLATLAAKMLGGERADDGTAD